MKLRDKGFIRKIQFPLTVASGTLPLVWTLMDFRGSEMLPLSWLFPLVYIIFAFGGLLIRGKIRLIYGVMACIVSSAIWIAVMPRQWIVVSVIISLFYCVLLMWSMKIAGWSDTEELPGVWLGIGIVSHLLGQLVLHMDKVSEFPQIQFMAPYFLLSFFLFALLVMLSANRRGLVNASGKRRGIPKEMRSKNVILTVALFAVGIAIALLPSVFNAFKSLWYLVVELIKRLVAMLPSRQAAGQQITGEMSAGGIPMMTEGEPGRLAIILEKVALVFGAIISAFLVGYIMYRLYKILRGWILKMWAALGRYAASATEDYEDEVTDTRDSGISEHMRTRSKKQRLRHRNEKNMTPSEYVRYRYLRLFIKHPEWGMGSTARENIPYDLASVYEQVRYSDHPITDADAARFADGVKRL